MPDNNSFFEDDLAILQEFVEESKESLGSVESQFVALEKNPEDQELINAIFRPIHSIKGNSAFLGLMNIRVLAHEMESALDGIRKGALDPDETVVSGLLAGVDFLKDMLARIQKQEPECGDKAAFDAMVHKVKALNQTSPPADDEQTKTSEPVSEPASKKKRTDKPVEGQKLPAGKTIRVREGQVQEIRDLVGELDGIHKQLVGVSTLITENPSKAKAELEEMCDDFRSTLGSINEHFETMQKVPVRELLQRAPRIARETCAQTGKPAQINMKGEGVLVSRSLLESLESPLMHMIRNAIDHGIEAPSDRRKTGKIEQGSVWVEVSETDSQVLLRVADDGAGIDFKSLLMKAMKQGLITNARSLTPKDITNLIFLPGLSTAKDVTDLSGRGVGMDVVKHEVESAGGTIEVSSKSGKGTEFILRFLKE